MKIVCLMGSGQRKGEYDRSGRRNWLWAGSLILLLVLLGLFPMTGRVMAATAQTVTVWIQVTDSCQQALSGATFTVVGPGVHSTTGATNGRAPVTLGGHVGCPISNGTCVGFGTGCTTAVLNVPGSGVATYKITVAKTAPGQGSNLRYATCEGGSDCRHGPEVATVHVSSSGAVSATVLNHYPDGTVATWPGGQGAYNGSQDNPIMFHEFGIGDGSIQCDGDHDADDFLTGAPGKHCDSDGDTGANVPQKPALKVAQRPAPRVAQRLTRKPAPKLPVAKRPVYMRLNRRVTLASGRANRRH